MEKKFGKYAIKNLSLILIMCYACGYLMKWINPGFFTYLYLNPYEIIHHFQIWRLLTWLIVPPDSFDFWTLLMLLYFYYSIGTSLERTWGTYRYNVYIFFRHSFYCGRSVYPVWNQFPAWGTESWIMDNGKWLYYLSDDVQHLLCQHVHLFSLCGNLPGL